MGVMTSANAVLKNFILWMIVCFVNDALNGYILNVLKCQIKTLQKYAKMIYLFFYTCELKMSECFKCKLICKNLKNC